MSTKMMTMEDLEALIDARAQGLVRKILSKTPLSDGSGKGRALLEAELDNLGSREVAKVFSEEEVVSKGESGFRGLREFLFIVAKSPGDERLVSAAKAMTIGDPEAGGYLVPTEYSTRLISLAIEAGRIFPLCQSDPMKSNEVKSPVAVSMDESSGLLFGGVKFGWVDEEGTKQEKDFKLQQIDLKAHVCAALCKASNQLLEDSSPRAEEVIRNIFGKSYAWTLDDAVMNGTGAGQPLGIIKAPCRYAVAKEQGQASATINWTNVKKMFARLWPGSKESQSLRWLINDEAVEQVLSLNEPIGTGGSSVIMASGDGIRPIPKTLLGIPIIWTSHASALGTEGDIVLADLGMYLVGIRRALTAAVSIHKYFSTNHSLFRFEGRLDGQPVIPTTIKTRTNFETSPFVTLATR